jgi:hypothetical protein
MINIYKERKSKMKHITQFFAAVLVILAFILLSSSTSSLLKISPSSSTCLVSFGDYHGHKYHSVGTVGQGKCLVQSKWMRVMQVSSFCSFVQCIGRVCSFFFILFYCIYYLSFLSFFYLITLPQK